MISKGRNVFDFLVFSNLFIAFCAVAMCICTVASFHLGKLPVHFVAFIFFSTLASYSIHWYLTNADVEVTATRTSWLKHHKEVHAAFFIISAIGTGIFLLQLAGYWRYIIPAVGLTLMYTAPKFPHPVFKRLEKYILGKTFLLAAMWTYVTAVLPFFIVHADWKASFYIYIFNRFTLLFAICILFDIRDRQFDKQTGVKSLVTILPLNKIKILFIVFIVLNLFSSGILYIYNQSITDLIFLAAPGLFTYFLYPLAIKSKNDYLFYFILDGLMALTAVLYFMKNVFDTYIQ
ncbi:hypothetical protein A8C56_15965 [Niabella ginsenosidivorans]|uniref:UbiA prenyltransferase family protein n=1 Tax=Niabella ginsenosidivorans TaxID=1176587 RepID=A0A1A9I3K8_9BACT|nr:hypothetical protein [Niabella ginsenosidivorans]ANH82257.1 hypothetical protein A8C56_15965 [Niabella ginsenosidivorans]